MLMRGFARSRRTPSLPQKRLQRLRTGARVLAETERGSFTESGASVRGEANIVDIVGHQCSLLRRWTSSQRFFCLPWVFTMRMSIAMPVPELVGYTSFDDRRIDRSDRTPKVSFDAPPEVFRELDAAFGAAWQRETNSRPSPGGTYDHTLQTRAGNP